MKRIETYREWVKTTQTHAPIGELIEMKFTHVEAGKAIFELEVQPKHLNSINTVQGGVLTIMADAAMGIAFGSLLEQEQGFSTLEIKINFIRPIFSGHLKAIGSVIHQGKRTGMTECEIYLEDHGTSKLAVKASSSLVLL